MAITQEKPLSDKRENYCQIYCKNGFNATQAYKKAYPNCKSGHKQAGQRLLTIVDVKLRIDEIKAKCEVIRLEGVEKIDKQFTELLADCLKKGDRVVAARCLENKAKHEGYFAADNEQQSQSKALTEAQEAEYEEFIAWKRRQMLRPSAAG